jgi:polyvinyl alcohol dehydrogenase (cytochrome)
MTSWKKPMRVIAALALLCLLPVEAPSQGAPPADGEALYLDRCANCHDGGVARAPDAASLRQMSAASIRAALTTGSMSAQGQRLSATEIEAVSRFLGRASDPMPASGSAMCAKVRQVPADPFALPHWNGWGADLAQHRFQPTAMAQLRAEDVPKLKLAWAFGFPGVNRAYAQPTVVGGRLFVGAANRNVYSLDAKTGCIVWEFKADAGVRSAISIGIDQRGWTAYFGDQRADVYAVDALSGALRWKVHVEDHPAAIITGAPALVEPVLYVPVTSYEEATGADPYYSCCSFRGSIVALDVASGKVLWKSYTISEAPEKIRKNEVDVQLFGPSGAGIWSSPTVDRTLGMLYSATGDSYSDPAADTSDAILAFRLNGGEMVWSRQMTAGDAFTIACGQVAPGKGNCPQAGGPDLDFGSSPILVRLANGRRALIAGQKSGMVHAVDPDREGAILWQRRLGQGGTLGGIQWGSAVDEHNVYVALSDVRTRRVSGTTAGAQRSIFGPSLLVDPGVGGGMYALVLESGEVVWHTPHPGCHDVPGCSPAQSAAVTAIPGVVFSGGLDGHLRAYEAASGHIIWDVDTMRTYETVNGLAALGGSLDGPGPVVVGGMLYVNSGYAIFGGSPGNVLLAFSVGGQ